VNRTNDNTSKGKENMNRISSSKVLPQQKVISMNIVDQRYFKILSFDPITLRIQSCFIVCLHSAKNIISYNQMLGILGHIIFFCFIVPNVWF
jgi:hypothetical protein